VQQAIELAEEIMDEEDTFAEFTFQHIGTKKRVVFYPHEEDFYFFGYSESELVDILKPAFAPATVPRIQNGEQDSLGKKKE
jgi:hypothetical protein